MPNIKSIVSRFLKNYPDADGVIVVKYGGKIIHSTKGFNISGDMKSIIATWQSGRGVSVQCAGTKYSILQCAPERFVATNRFKKGHLVGATTPDKNYYFLAHIKPKAKGWVHSAYPFIARAAALMENKGTLDPTSKSSIKQDRHSSNKSSAAPDRDSGKNAGDPSTNYSQASLGSLSSRSQDYAPQTPQVDPNLKAEMEGFLQWLRDPTGLSGYIRQALEKNDRKVLKKLGPLYKVLYDICN